jgi:hypothetical protein
VPASSNWSPRRDRIESGVVAYGALETLKANPKDINARAVFELHRRDLGYACCSSAMSPIRAGRRPR